MNLWDEVIFLLFVLLYLQNVIKLFCDFIDIRV